MMDDTDNQNPPDSNDQTPTEEEAQASEGQNLNGDAPIGDEGQAQEDAASAQSSEGEKSDGQNGEGEEEDLSGWGLDGSEEAQSPLSQNDIDSMFSSGSADEEKVFKKGLKAILEAGFVHYERLPMLEVVFDRLTRILTTTLRNFTGENIDVSLEEITSIRYGNFLDTIPIPAMIGVFKAQEWDNYGVMVADTSLIYAMIDVLLGGRRGGAIPRIDGRPYTSIERKLLERMMHVILSDISSCFEPLSPVTFHFERLEVNPRFAMIIRPGNAAILVNIGIETDERGGGRIQLVLPYATLEPIRDLLLQTYLGEKFGRDSIWETHLASQLFETDVELDAILARTKVTLREVLHWEVGTHIPLDVTPDEIITLSCRGKALLKGRVGHKNNNIAVKVSDILFSVEEDEVA